MKILKRINMSTP